MSAPKRWLEEAGGATELERDVLRSGLPVEPPTSAKDDVWAALLAQLPPGGGAPSGGSASGGGAKAAGAKAAAGGSGAGVTSTVSGGILKSALIGAGSAVALIAGYAVIAPGEPTPTPPPQITTASVAPGPRLAASGSVAILAPPAALDAPEAPSAPASSTKAAEPKASDSGAVPEQKSRLREESERLGEARAALRSGDALAALAKLDALEHKFPGGMLVQEREALTIEALHKSGRRADAAARAAAFLKAYPTSPHAPRLQAFTQ